MASTTAKVKYNVVKKSSGATDAELNVDGQFTWTGDGYIHLGYGQGHVTYDGRSLDYSIQYYPSINTDADAAAKSQEVGSPVMYFNEQDGELRVYDTSAGGSSMKTIVKSGVSANELRSEVSNLTTSIDVAKKSVLDQVYLKVQTYSQNEIDNMFTKLGSPYSKADADAAHDALEKKILAENARAELAEKNLQAELDSKAKAAEYGIGVDFKKNDFVINANKIYLVVNDFVSNGNFTSQENNVVALQSDTGNFGVVEYATNMEIKNGQTVLYNNDLYICKADIANTTDWATDSVNMVSYGSSIDLTGYYTSAQVDALLANKTDLLTQGDGVKVDRSLDNKIIVSADMDKAATANKIAQRDAEGALYGKTAATATDDMLINNALFTTELAKKQNILTAGNNITISDSGVISSTAPTSEKFESGVHDGYSLYTVYIDEAKAYYDPDNCITLANDAVGKTRDQITSFLGYYPCLTNEGKELGKLNPDNYTKVLSGTGTTSTIGVDAMVKFPKRGIKFSRNSQVIRIDFTDDPNASGFDYQAFMQSSSKLQDCFFYGVYQGYVLNSKLYSVRNFTPAHTITMTNFRAYAKARQTTAATALGRLYTLPTWHMVKYIQACYVLTYQSLNSQKTVGYGRQSGGSVCTTGGADTWGIHSQNMPSANKTNGTSNVKALGIEDLWGNAWDWVDGIYVDGYYRICTSVDVATFNDYGYGYKPQGIGIRGGAGGVGYVTSVVGSNELGFMPMRVDGGSDSKGYCDYFWQNTNRCCLFGGGWPNGSQDGVFCFYLGGAASNAGSSHSGRLCLL